MLIRNPRNTGTGPSGIAVLLSLLTSSVFFMVSCQKGNPESNKQPPVQTDPNGEWVLESRRAKGFATSYGHFSYDHTIHFIYDWYSHLMIVRDTNNDNKAYAEYIYRYDEQGKVTGITEEGKYVVKLDRFLSYDQGFLVKVNSREESRPEEDGLFEWMNQNGQSTGKFTDPSIHGSPYSDGDRQFGMNAQQQLMQRIRFSNDPIYGDERMEVIRNAQQNVTVRKHWIKENDSWTLRDSIVYTRDASRPRRLSNFQAMISKGITWFAHDQGISYMPMIHYNSDYFEYDQDLANRVVYYEKQEGRPTLIKVHEVILNTVYDSDGNPVKQTVFRDGQKEVEISFVWQKVKWLK